MGGVERELSHRPVVLEQGLVIVGQRTVRCLYIFLVNIL